MKRRLVSYVLSILMLICKCMFCVKLFLSHNHQESRNRRKSVSKNESFQFKVELGLSNYVGILYGTLARFN